MKFTKRMIRADDPVIEPGSDIEVIDKIRDPVKLSAHIINMTPRKREQRYRRIYLSEIDGVCPREWVLGNIHSKKKIESIVYPRQQVMNLGSALHWWVQNNPDKFFGEGNFLGFWRCYSCGYRRRFGVKPKNPCENCGASNRATFYSEYKFRRSNPLVVGKVDGIIKIKGRYRFGDIKSTAKDISAPPGKDIIQICSYIEFYKKDDLPIEIDKSAGYLMYFNKTFNYRAPVKTFLIRPTQTLMRPIKAKANAFTSGVMDGVIPPVLQECQTSAFTIGRAKNCNLLNKCKEIFQNATMS